MVKTKISDLGSREIAVSGLGEIRKPALGDGISKPGDAVGFDIATGRIVAHDEGVGTTAETFYGIVDDLPTIAEDTAITAGLACSVIKPQGGHVYRVGITNPGGATHIKGWNIGLSADAGKFAGLATANTAGVRGNLHKAMANGDTVGEVEWGI